MIDSISVNGVTYWLPANNEEVISIVEEAHRKKEVICMRGAAHSFPIIGDLENGYRDGRKYRFVMLSKMNAVDIDEKTGVVTVQAGCHLGKDPYDPTGISYTENSFLYQIDQAGWAISDLGGIIHQSMGGFMSTGSSGGSTQYSFDNPLISIDIVQISKEGKAEVVTYEKPDLARNPKAADDPFFAVAVSMGLMGVIVSLKIQCDPKFYITGSETISYRKDCEINLFGDPSSKYPDLADFLDNTEFTRLMWWPQMGVNKMVVWQAQKATQEEAEKYAADAYASPCSPPNPDPPPLKPYEEVPWILGSAQPATLAADLVYTGIGQWPNWLIKLMGNTTLSQALQIIVGTSFYPVILPQVLDIFVPIDKPECGPQRFADVGWKGLPMDNQMNDRMFPVKFTELWIDIKKTTEVMKALHQFYTEGPQNTGAFSCEIYAAKDSLCWMSPAYKTKVVRVDVFWFGNDLGEPIDFYQKFWDLLAPFDFRPHWGKYLPKGKYTGSTSGDDFDTWIDYLKHQYPKWDEWMTFRNHVDPHQVFVNEYWREHLGIPIKRELKEFFE